MTKSSFILHCLCIILGTVVGYEFYIDVNLPTVRNGTKKFIIDTTIVTSFMMDHDTYKGSLDPSSTFNPADSYAFINKSRPYDVSVRDTQGPHYMKGYTGNEAFELMPKLGVRHDFAIIRKSDNLLPVTNLVGETRVGRLGFLKADQYTSSIPFRWLQKLQEKKVCLHITESEDLRVRHGVVAIGVKAPESRIITRYNTRDKKGFEQIPVSNFAIDGEDLRFSGGYARIDAALNKMTLPSNNFDRIVQILDAKFDNATKEYTVRCDKIKTFGLHVANKPVEIRFQDLVHRDKNEKLCRLLFARSNVYANYLGIPAFINRGMCMDHNNGEFILYDASYKKESPIFADASEYGGFVQVNNE